MLAAASARKRVPGLEFHLRLFRVEAHRPLPAGSLQTEDALRVRADLRRVLHAVDLGQGQRLIAEVNHVLHVALRNHAGQARIVGGLPRIPSHLVRAHDRRIAVGLIGRKLVPAGVVKLEVLRNLLVIGGTRDAGDILFEEAREHAHAAEHVRRSGDHARPHRALLFEPIERTRIVVEALFQEMQLLALDQRISLRRRV